ncbi:hypothetical protein ACFQ1E_17885 [Sphingomonas canadensis]|uniref:Uncharacterized protein n=1 Tax=Sphingomonas canadensis TaxID=1219257 RepID=A0ABW3H9Q2_9SPHN|nr:hypothetical protein [Sphingomonas canadensis]MCW3837988.1 hypothetical protein [Sphingomonas canadensis]
MTVTGIGGATATGTSPGSATKAKDSSTFDAILEAFRKAASQTPEERAREAVLKKHHLSEESYRKLPAGERETIDREIAEAVRLVHERKTGVALQDAPVPVEKLFG